MFNLAVVLIIIQTLFAKDNFSESEIVFRWMVLFPLGVTCIYTFIMHAFFPRISAGAIGWHSSPFQYEVAIADLAIGVLGILSFRNSYGFRLATIIASTIWLWGDAIGHIYQMIKYHNFSLGNAGSWFWMDLILPFILILSVVNLRRKTIRL